MPFIVQRRVGADLQVREHTGSRLRLGRGSGVDVRFADPGIDFEHAEIEDTAEGFVLRDLDSPGGTWVNGAEVAEAVLKPGDRIDLGVHEASVRIQGFGSLQYLYLDFEEIGADDSVLKSGLHSMTVSFASRELQDLAREARARYEKQQRAAASKAPPRSSPDSSSDDIDSEVASEAVTGPIRSASRAPSLGDAGPAGRSAEEVSAAHLLELFTESDIDLRDSFVEFDRELKESIEKAGDSAPRVPDPSEAPTAPMRTLDSVEAEETATAETEPSSEPDAPWSDVPLSSPPSKARSDSPSDEVRPAVELSQGPTGPTPQPVPPTAPSAAPPPSLPSPPTPTEPRSGDAAPQEAERAIDYVAAYSLPGGLTVAWSLALLVLIFGLGSATVAAMRHTDLLSPGPLGGRHADAEGLTCASCHTGFLGVRESSCLSCHSDVHDHQAVMADERGCISCHTEHRGGDALRLADPDACISCHSSLSDTRAAAGQFADRITAFSRDHPEFAVYVGPERRVRLDTEEARSSDPGGLKGFNHYWHMQKLPSRILRECSDCHQQDEAGEILPVDFERNCRECHQLAFDPRFRGEQTPHDTPTVVTGFLVGFYVEHREVLRQLTPTERRLGGGSLSTEERLTRVAELVSARLLRTQCSTCHELSRATGSQGATRVQVKPVRITERWFPHAEPFPHGKHVPLTECSDCHALAPTSRDTSDLILPSQVACKTCHRPAGPTESEPERLASSTCRTCHTFHAGPVEVRSWQTAEQVARPSGADGVSLVAENSKPRSR